MIPGQIVCEDYEIIKKVGEGSFGFVYKVRHRTTHEVYALKTDQKSVTKMELQNQVHVIKALQERSKKYQQKKKSQQRTFVRCLNYFFSDESSNKMLMPLYGQNLFNIFQKCNKRFDSNTIFEVSRAMLDNIEKIHSLGFIHRDIKPQNFVIADAMEQKNRQNDEIYLVDFGLTKPYKTFNDYEEKQIHLPYEIGQKIRGTPMYMSINVMLGIEPSRRDDLESLIYIVVLLMKGRLPWHSLKIKKKDFDDLIVSKVSMHPDQLFSNLPKQLKEIFLYIRKLKFQDKPDYEKIRNSFESILLHKNESIEKEYNGGYRKYCWQVTYKKQFLANNFGKCEKNEIENYISQIQSSILN